MDSTQTDLEIKVTFLEQTVNELSEVLYDQQKTIDQLATRLAELSDRLAAGEQADPLAAPQKPPHY